MHSIHDVLDQFRKAAMDERDKGDLFEKLTKRFLEIDPLYSTLFSEVWLFKDWAKERGLGAQDTGIDLVAKFKESDDYAAIQCKFYAEDTYLDLPTLGTFFATSGKAPFTHRFIVSTTNNWSKTAEDAIQNQTLPVTRINTQDLENSAVDWATFSLKDPASIVLQRKKTPYDHQRKAIDKAKEHFSTHDRGKLIMACGTGKTYTSLNIVEEMTPKGGTVLFLVPSIALMSQTLKEWKREAKVDFRAYAVCSDTKVGRREDDSDTSIPDLAYPATTKTQKLAAHFKTKTNAELTVIFSTYQSIEVVAQAQSNGVPEFDLIVCDEAHRTTGVTLSNDDESAFVRVHNNDFVKAKKRLYMTATPRLYQDSDKKKAEEADAVLASMDDESIFGEEFHRLGFGQAVTEKLLSDYKVLVLAVSETHVSTQLQALLAKNGELELNDAIKIVGCYNGLRKRSDSAEDFLVDPNPMKSAVAFARSIKDSKRIAEMFEVVTEALNAESEEPDPLRAEAQHVDGTFNVLARNKKLEWLEDASTDNTVRILSNAKCLSEGVDVPALDAVLFLNPRDSQVDIVQSVGRVMRKAPGKEYGYIILPITIPAGQSPEDVLADHQAYKTVWQVLQALRSHDERFNAYVNKIDLSGNDIDSPIQILNVGIGKKGDERDIDSTEKPERPVSQTLWDFDDWKDAIFAKIVQKVGQRTYWENWAQDVATIAKNHISRITHLVSGDDEALAIEFAIFLRGLQDNLNPSVTADDAIEMLAQHLITKPVFDALFEGYAFTDLNPVSVSMQRMVTALESASMNDESESLDGFYESVRLRASGITDGDAKQKIVKELYEKFFRLAFSGTSDKLGIVYTPNEIVDFMIHSVDDVLKSEFGTRLGKEGVQVLDPFTGTGTFIVRLLQSGLISSDELRQKFRHELHANEIVLLAYYVAAINIEEAYHSIVGKYEPFQGIVLTDTFQMNEGDDSNELPGLEVFPENNVRVLAQKGQSIQVIIGNPPYSVGQSSANEDNQNVAYPDLDRRIEDTYASKSTASLKKSLFDSYIRAFRWASDRIETKGVVCFVSNGGYLDSNSADGFRISLAEEFSDIYVFNLKGNTRSSGEAARREGGQTFGSGSRTTIAITLLVKNPASKSKGNLYYYEIGDYLTRIEKLEAISNFVSVKNIPWTTKLPSIEGDWVRERNREFETFAPIADRKDTENGIFGTYSQGVKTNRDAWVSNFSRVAVESNVERLIENYNVELEKFNTRVSATSSGRDLKLVRGNMSRDPLEINWDGSLENYAVKNKRLAFDKTSITTSHYRPFTLQNLYLNRELNNSVYQMPKLFPKTQANFGFYITAPGSGFPFTALAMKYVPDIAFWGSGSGQFFPRYVFHDSTAASDEFSFETESSDSGNITFTFVEKVKRVISASVTGDDVFHYVYGILNSPEYKSRYSDDLKLMLPRIPISENFFEISKIGEVLFDIHANFESVDYTRLNELVTGKRNSRVEKMKIVVASNETLSVVVNSSLTLTDIPARVLDYRLGSRSALDWVIERYRMKTEKQSQIVNDPNTWGQEHNNPDYVVEIVNRVVSLSEKTLSILAKMPPIGKTF